MNALFLDRDGVINVLRQGDYVKHPDELELLPGVAEALRMLRPLRRRHSPHRAIPGSTRTLSSYSSSPSWTRRLSRG